MVYSKKNLTRSIYATVSNVPGNRRHEPNRNERGDVNDIDLKCIAQMGGGEPDGEARVINMVRWIKLNVA